MLAPRVAGGAVVAIDWTTVGALATAVFTGILALIGAIGYRLGSSDREWQREQRQRRARLKQVLGDAMARGRGLQRDEQATDSDVVAWTSQVGALIEEALGRGEQHVWFAAAELGDESLAAPENRTAWLERCDRALSELVQRADSLEVENFALPHWRWPET